jgi:hypothetical protein
VCFLATGVSSRVFVSDRSVFARVCLLATAVSSCVFPQNDSECCMTSQHRNTLQTVEGHRTVGSFMYSWCASESVDRLLVVWTGAVGWGGECGDVVGCWLFGSLY